MKYQIKWVYILWSISLLCYPIYARYHALPLKKMHASITTNSYDFVAFDYKILSKSECKQYFNTKRFFKKGYKLIQLLVVNNSSTPIFFSLEGLTFRCAHVQDVVNCLNRDGINRGFGFGLGALFFSPLIIPACVQGFGARRYNRDMMLDYEQKALTSQIIPAYSAVQGVVFAAKDQFSPVFKIYLQDIGHKNTITLSSTSPRYYLNTLSL